MDRRPCAATAEHLAVDRTRGETTISFRGRPQQREVRDLPAPPRTRDRTRTGDCRLADATYLPAVLPARGSRVQWWTDPAGGDGSWTYVVTALDRTWNESAPRQVSTR